jgi:hypothetical protein
MTRRQNLFEIQVYVKDHWVIEAQESDEAAAVAFAKAQVSQGKVEGMRVLRQWKRADGAVVETEIFCQFRPKNDRITIQTVDSAPKCEEMDEYYGSDSRLTIGRVLRSYLEQVVVTPTEIMHNFAELKRLRDKDTLVPSAIGHVAQVQSAGSGDSRGRRDEMFNVLEKVTVRARNASRRELPNVKTIGFSRLVEELTRGPADESADFLSLVALSRELVNMRNFAQKTQFLVSLLVNEEAMSPESTAIIDGVIADVLGSATVIQDLLGPQPNLMMAIINLCDLAEGKLDVSKRHHEDFAIPMNRQFAEGKLPSSRLVLLDWVRRQLKGTQPLNRHEPSRERDTFTKLLQRMVSPGGVIGGGPVAEGLTLRRVQYQDEGGVPGRQRAIQAIIEDLPDPANRLRFLMSTLNSGLVLQIGDYVRARIDTVLASAGPFTDASRPVKDNLARMTDLWREMRDCDAPEADRKRVMERLDDLLCAYIDQSKIIERLDDPTAILRYRAIRLIQLCASGALESPRALDSARRRVVEHLRQPNFEDKFVSDIPDPETRAKALKDFFDLLKRAGFR